MIKVLILSFVLLLFGGIIHAQSVFAPYLQQSAMYYASDMVTAGGIGGGAGVQFVWRDHYIAQTDAAIYWANGNAFVTRLSGGYQRSGRWSPAILGSLGLIWGQRTEILTSSGERPGTPVWTLGIRGTPLRFRTKSGYVTALEIGFGVGPENGTNIEFSLLNICISL